MSMESPEVRPADPSPELCLIAALIIVQTKGKPAKVERLVREMRAFVETHRQMSNIIRLRGAEYDRRVLIAMSEASAWLDRMEPFLSMMAKR
jgi:hypothetical protein